MDKKHKKESFIERKRPTVENLVEDVMGPAGQLDELVLGKPPVEDLYPKKVE
jgi:hypothetical protein